MTAERLGELTKRAGLKPEIIIACSDDAKQGNRHLAEEEKQGNRH